MIIGIQYLQKYLLSREVFFEAQLARHAKYTSHSTSHLARDTDRDPIELVCLGRYIVIGPRPEDLALLDLVFILWSDMSMIHQYRLDDFPIC